jgi:hypothetical protein
VDQLYLSNEHGRISEAVGLPVGYLQREEKAFFSFCRMQEEIVQHIVLKLQEKR